MEIVEKMGEGKERSKPYELSARQRAYLKWKRRMDWALSGAAIVVLSPVLGMISLLIKVESPGPVLFKQKRVGKDQELFEIWKFRSMRSDTPKDVPTHMLSDPDRYITKIGAFLRKTSLEGNDIIRQTTESLVNKGFREVSPISFLDGS